MEVHWLQSHASRNSSRSSHPGVVPVPAGPWEAEPALPCREPVKGGESILSHSNYLATHVKYFPVPSTVFHEIGNITNLSFKCIFHDCVKKTLSS